MSNYVKIFGGLFIVSLLAGFIGGSLDLFLSPYIGHPLPFGLGLIIGGIIGWSWMNFAMNRWSPY